jgi:hypothetical protein
MPATSKFLDDSVVLRAKEGLKELGKSAIISRKLQAIISARVHGISKVASIYNTKVHHACALRALENQGFSRYQCSSKDEYWYNVTNKTLTFWIKSLRNGSICGF